MILLHQIVFGTTRRGIFDGKARMLMAEYMGQNIFELALKPSQKSSFGFDEKALMMTDYMQNEHLMKHAPDFDGFDNDDDEDVDEAEELAAYRGEMLHGFLQCQGKEDAVAEQTAASFQAFLKKQQDALRRLSVSASSRSSESSVDESRGACSEPIRPPDRMNGIPAVISKSFGTEEGHSEARYDSAPQRGESLIRRASGRSTASALSMGSATSATITSN